MFEKYTEKARRVIFMARYEVSEFGAKFIEPEHLLLGLLREDKPLVRRFLPPNVSIKMLREQIKAHMHTCEKIPVSVEISLSRMSREVLLQAHEESENLGHKHIGPEHLLLGLLQREKSRGLRSKKESLAAKVLHENSLELSAIRQQIKDDSESDHE